MQRHRHSPSPLPPGQRITAKSCPRRPGLALRAGVHPGQPGPACRRPSTPLASARSFSLRVIVPLITTSVIAAGMSSAASASAAPAPRPSTAALSAVRMADLAGFADVSQSQLTPSAAITALPLTPDLIIRLGPAHGTALADQAAGVAITGTGNDGSVVVAKANRAGFGFGIVTSRHGILGYSFKALLAPGTTIKAAPDGGLNQVSATGAVIAHISPAYAVDSAGTRLPAAYSFDARSSELIVKANTSHAKGTVFIDPSWRCVLTVSGIGLGWLLAAAAWLFSDGVGASFMYWALRTWFGLSVNAANIITRACA
jgi:hypothetical protein